MPDKCHIRIYCGAWNAFLIRSSRLLRKLACEEVRHCSLRFWGIVMLVNGVRDNFHVACSSMNFDFSLRVQDEEHNNIANVFVCTKHMKYVLHTSQTMALTIPLFAKTPEASTFKPAVHSKMIVKTRISMGGSAQEHPTQPKSQ